MKKHLNSLVIIAICMISINTQAQDLIIKKDGTDISAKVLEITTSEIKYNKFENLTGPIYTVLKSDVLMIRYENGTKDIFNESETIKNVSAENEDTNDDVYKVEINKFGGKKVEMQKGEKIDIIELVDKKGRKLNAFIYRQDGQKLKYMSVFHTLQDIDICSEEIRIAKKHRTNAFILATGSFIFFPLGYAIMVSPMIKQRQKEMKHVFIAVKIYNKSLE